MITRVAQCLLLLAVAAEARGQECVPECRAGYVCHAGACVSRCNPACPPSERCRADGECELTSEFQAPRPPPVVQEPQRASPLAPCIAEQLPGWESADAREKKELLDRCRTAGAASSTAGPTVTPTTLTPRPGAVLTDLGSPVHTMSRAELRTELRELLDYRPGVTGFGFLAAFGIAAMAGSGTGAYFAFRDTDSASRGWRPSGGSILLAMGTVAMVGVSLAVAVISIYFGARNAPIRKTFNDRIEDLEQQLERLDRVPISPSTP